MSVYGTFKEYPIEGGIQPEPRIQSYPIQSVIQLKRYFEKHLIPKRILLVYLKLFGRANEILCQYRENLAKTITDLETLEPKLKVDDLKRDSEVLPQTIYPRQIVKTTKGRESTVEYRVM